MESKPSSSSHYPIVLKKIKFIFDKFDELLIRFKAPGILKNSRVFSVILIVIILLLGYVLTPISSSANNVPVYKVIKNELLISITESGEIRAKHSISISAPRVRGNLKIVYMVPEGTYVSAGDTVVKFDPTEALTNLKDAQAKLEIALSDKAKMIADHKSTMTKMQGDLKSAELSYELSKLNLEQMKFEASIKQQEAKLNHQKNELAYAKAKQDLESQKIIQKSELNKVDIEVQQKRTDLERAKRDLAALTLTAPTEGLVVYENNWSTGRKMAIGDTPWPGMTVISLPDLSSMESVTYVNEVDVSRVKKGLNVLVKLDAFQDSTFPGVISSVASLGKDKDRNSKIKVFEIDVDIKSQSSILKPGMTTSNKIIVNKIPNVMFVPQESVFEKGNEKIVYVKNGSGFDEKDVSVGEKSENYIVITKGINPGDEVALRDPNIKLDGTETPGEKPASVQMPSSVN